ncbi:hypothetical protein [Leptolyngbya sp. KIOST-1]|uniref:hypothetical protein n=1 Tax=Leptolyngbya sp. KIOST-1 TaxID=1229172 RepID=UPI0012DFFDAE|nr:hypothetical protein [Leptolyngbya sp. KIOST-1]
MPTPPAQTTDQVDQASRRKMPPLPPVLQALRQQQLLALLPLALCPPPWQRVAP